jgi:hypothetical protein
MLYYCRTLADLLHSDNRHTIDWAIAKKKRKEGIAIEIIRVVEDSRKFLYMIHTKERAMSKRVLVSLFSLLVLLTVAFPTPTHAQVKKPKIGFLPGVVDPFYQVMEIGVNEAVVTCPQKLYQSE